MGGGTRRCSGRGRRATSAALALPLIPSCPLMPLLAPPVFDGYHASSHLLLELGEAFHAASDADVVACAREDRGDAGLGRG